MQLKRKVAAVMLAAASIGGQAADVWREPHTGMEFIALPKGCFQMGSPADAFREESNRLFVKRVKAEMPQHEVCLDAFWIGRLEVRRSDWKKVMDDLPHGAAQEGADDAPVAGMTWEEAAAFARKLGELTGDKQRFRLPTEAEWEYACRAGEKTGALAPDKAALDASAWFSVPLSGDAPGMRIQELQQGAGKAANGFGLYDMLGNAWEWTQDAYRADAYTRHALYNPSVEGTSHVNEPRVIRGGSIRTDRRLTRCGARAWLAQKDVHDTVGLRLVRIR